MAVAPSAELSDIVGPDHVRAPEGIAFDVDGTAPETVVSPGSDEEVARVLRHAGANRLAAIPFGSGTMMHLGNAPAKYDIALHMSRLNRLVEYEPADLTVTCQAGMTLQALQDRLAEAGQTLPLGPFAGGGATIGGILASNSIGAYVHAYGRPRDMTIGMRVATADGRIARAGGRVVKNVAGYDLCKLYIGSLGTLGVIVEATFKVAPVPATEARCAFAMPGPAEACGLAQDIERAGLSARAIEIVVDGRDCIQTIDLAGSPRAVERSQAEATTLCSQHGGRATEAHSDFPASLDAPSFACRISSLPDRVPGILENLSSLEPAPRVVAWPTTGITFALWPETDEEGAAFARLTGALREDENLVLGRCSPETKRHIDIFGDPPPSFNLMRQIKEHFDPNGTLSPGRLVGRL